MSHIPPVDTSGYTWGVFTDEGMLVGQLSYASAMREAAEADPEDNVTVDRECSDHPEHAERTCEECARDDDEDEDN